MQIEGACKTITVNVELARNPDRDVSPTFERASLSPDLALLPSCTSVRRTISKWRVTRVVLFDIDGTLVLTGGAGARAMTQAFEQVFGAQAGASPSSRLAGVPMAGRTDTWIVGEMSRIYGVESDPDSLQRFHDIYVTHLAREIHRARAAQGCACPVCASCSETLFARETMRTWRC